MTPLTETEKTTDQIPYEFLGHLFSQLPVSMVLIALQTSIRFTCENERSLSSHSTCGVLVKVWTYPLSVRLPGKSASSQILFPWIWQDACAHLHYLKGKPLADWDPGLMFRF